MEYQKKFDAMQLFAVKLIFTRQLNSPENFLSNEILITDSLEPEVKIKNLFVSLQKKLILRFQTDRLFVSPILLFSYFLKMRVEVLKKKEEL